MGESLEKISTEERVRFLLLKHKGILSRVVEEAHVDIAYVRQIADKIKKRRDHDVSCQVATMISMEIIEGHEARVAHLRDALYQMQQKAEQQHSLCCDAPVRIYTWGKTEVEALKVDKPKDKKVEKHELHFICTNCQQECTVSILGVNLGEYRRILNQWLLEDQSLAEFAEKMGLTFKEPQPTQIHRHFNVAVINQGGTEAQEPERKQVESHQILLGADGKELLKQAEELTPVTRELLRKNLEQKMVEEEQKELDEHSKN